MRGERYQLRYEQSAQWGLLKVDPAERGPLMARLQRLEVSPTGSESWPGGWWRSRAYERLKAQGYPIRVFRCSDVFGFRVFYFIDERSLGVLIKEVIPRGDDDETYDGPDLPHVQRLMDNYDEHRDAITTGETHVR